MTAPRRHWFAAGYLQFSLKWLMLAVTAAVVLIWAARWPYLLRLGILSTVLVIPFYLCGAYCSWQACSAESVRSRIALLATAAMAYFVGTALLTFCAMVTYIEMMQD